MLVHFPPHPGPPAGAMRWCSAAPAPTGCWPAARRKSAAPQGRLTDWRRWRPTSWRNAGERAGRPAGGRLGVRAQQRTHIEPSLDFAPLRCSPVHSSTSAAVQIWPVQTRLERLCCPCPPANTLCAAATCPCSRRRRRCRSTRLPPPRWSCRPRPTFCCCPATCSPLPSSCRCRLLACRRRRASRRRRGQQPWRLTAAAQERRRRQLGRTVQGRAALWSASTLAGSPRAPRVRQARAVALLTASCPMASLHGCRLRSSQQQKQ